MTPSNGMPWRHSRAQSETVGVVILVGVFATLATIVGVVIIADVVDQADDKPLTEFNVTANASSVTLTHTGGDTVDVSDVAVVLRRDSEQRARLSTFSELSGDGDGQFEPGETRWDTHSFGSGRLRVLVVHTPTNSVVYDEAIDALSVSTNAAPSPQFSASPSSPNTGESVTFDGSSSTDSDGTITAYEWDWTDDGAYDATGPTATHSYASAGTYTVRLRVTDDEGATETVTNTITVSTPADTTDPTAEAGPDQTVEEDTSTNFDGTASTDNVGVSSYSWDFGDGSTGSGATPSHTYADPGTYTVTLTVSDAAGNTDSDTLTVTVQDTTAPTAEAGPDQTVDEDTSTSFDGTASTDNAGVTSYSWDFGDGSTGSGATPSHTYASPGTYTVTLTVSDAAGNTASDTLTVTVEDTTAPTAEAGPDQTVPNGTQVSFDGSSSTDNVGIDSYSWMFGDGSTATGENPTHTYGSPGTYTVTLTVSDAAGNTDTDTLTMTVEDTAPTASLSLQPSSATTAEAITVDASGSSDDGTIVSYNYSLGDGYTANLSGQSFDYTFDCAGTYDVTVTVTDDDGKTDTATATATVSTASRNLLVAVNAGGNAHTSCEGVSYAEDTGQYLTSGANTASTSGNVNGTSDEPLYNTERWDPDTDLEYAFPFGNGTYRVTLKFSELYFGTDAAGGAGQRVFDVAVEGTLLEDDLDLYERVGPNTRYDVQYTTSVTDGTLDVTLGREIENPKLGAVLVERLDSPPTASFSTSTETPNTGDSVAFDASGSSDDNGIASYSWDFGDGSTATGETPTHTYASAGTYDVTLTVTDSAGYTDSTTLTAIVNAPPNAAFTASCTGRDCSFGASGSTDDGSIVDYSWDFGDGTMASGETAAHTYSSDGSYDVTLTVTDDLGATDTTTQTVSVVEGTPPSITGPTLTDATDGNATVSDGDTIRIEATVSDSESGVDTVSADATAFDAGTVSLTDPDGDGVYTVTATVGPGATEGSQSVTITASDAAGNSATATTGTLTVDTTAPTVETFDIIDNGFQDSFFGPYWNEEYDLTWTVTDQQLQSTTVTVVRNGTNSATYTTASGSQSYSPGFFIDWISGPEGIQYTFRIEAEDTAGNSVCRVVSDESDGSDPAAAQSC